MWKDIILYYLHLFKKIRAVFLGCPMEQSTAIITTMHVTKPLCNTGFKKSSKNDFSTNLRNTQQINRKPICESGDNDVILLFIFN